MNIALIAYSPLEQGLLTGKFDPNHKIGGQRGLNPKFRPRNLQKIQPLIEALKKVGQEYDKTPAQVALRWLLQRDPLIIPIPGAKNIKQAEQNAGALGWSLRETDFITIEQLAHR
jgi:aryl-alcohol dehydrogenase-like predicted oxidoreductase